MSQLSENGENRKRKSKSDKLKRMDYWKKRCGQAVSSKESYVATEPTISLHAGHETMMTSEPSTAVTVSSVKTESTQNTESVTPYLE